MVVSTIISTKTRNQLAFLAKRSKLSFFGRFGYAFLEFFRFAVWKLRKIIRILKINVFFYGFDERALFTSRKINCGAFLLKNCDECRCGYK